jgi:acyl-[acyl-carrier-protein]-phospholipid O-acyltransferase/long-chain-fatty-acid--[acyl-carrier-protein] ligase
MASGTYRATLRTPGLLPFLVTQFLGAFNDNVSKIIVTFVAMAAYGPVQGAAIVAAVFIVPFLIFSGYAGHLADRLSKRRVLVAVKIFEIGVMAVAIPGLLTGHAGLLLIVMFLMGVHSTFFSPSKYGVVPELVPAEQMSAANGLLEMSTFAAIVLGTAFGGALFERWHHRPLVLAGALMTIAAVGLLTSLGIPRVPAANPQARFSLNPWSEVWRGTKRLWPDVTLWGTVLGIAYFWFLGALLQTALLPFGQDVLAVSPEAATRLYTPLAVGIAIGSLVAGRLSGDKIELGLVPVGSFGLAIFALIFAWSSTYLGASAALAGLGFFGGFFAVPLNALLQQRPADEEKGRVQATNNFLQTIGILIAAGLLAALSGVGMSIRQILVLAGVLTLLVNAYILLRLPDFFVRFTLWMLTHTIYRIRISGRPHIPERGPALLVANHVSMVDGLLVAACVQRFIRFLVYAPYYNAPFIHALMSRMHAIPVSASSRRAIVDAIAQARAELAAGHVVCIFAEGAISRTGNMLPFKRGFERIVEGLDVPIVPIYLDRVWGSIFSFKNGRFIWKWPERLPYPVTVSFGAPMASSATAIDVRQTITELGTEAIRLRRPASDLLHLEFVKTARAHWRRLAMADSTGASLTYGRTLIAALALGRVLARRTAGEDTVGTMLPASVGGALANLALFLARRTPVNLNFTSGPEAIQGAIDQAAIRTIVTSRRFLAKAELPERPGMIFLEDLRSAVTRGDKVRALVQAAIAPRRLLARTYGRDTTIDSVATIIFSSGSTGVPKGVMLTHANLLANVDSLTQIFPMGPRDCFIGVLPFFHSFGFLGTFWFPLLQGASVAYHPNPMDAKTVGELAETYKATMLISTPTFCSTYVRRCTKAQFAHLRFAIVGAEKLREQVATEFRDKFGVPLLEGYGMTEMAPVVAVNRPDVDEPDEHQIGTKPGSVGHPIPGVAARVVDRETGADLPAGQEGLLLVKGPNLMRGYLHAPQRTAEVIRDGWYVTGDIAKLDEDGFIYITDRLSRFSKIGGEMVPHVRIEDAINEILGEAVSAVTSVTDEAKGERLVAFYVAPAWTPGALWERLAASDLPRLWIPKRDSLIPIDAIPVLGTGKVDLRRVRDLARELGERPGAAARAD